MATDFEDPLSSVNEIEAKFLALLDSKTTGKILLDLLCASGPGQNRFVTLEMKYGRAMLDMAKIINEQDVPTHILSKLIFILRDHPKHLEASVSSPDDVRRVLSMDF